MKEVKLGPANLKKNWKKRWGASRKCRTKMCQKATLRQKKKHWKKKKRRTVPPKIMSDTPGSSKIGETNRTGKTWNTGAAKIFKPSRRPSLRDEKRATKTGLFHSRKGVKNVFKFLKLKVNLNSSFTQQGGI